jgi:hypothetical protein
MAASPQYKVYDRHGRYVASVKEIEAGACLMGLYGDGATIRYGHAMVIWGEGEESQPGHESYDHVALVCTQRMTPYHAGRRQGHRS